MALPRALAHVSEALFFLLSSRVPYRRSWFWNTTPGTLELSKTSVTQSLDDTRRVLRWVPSYTTMEALDDIVAAWKAQQQQRVRAEKI